MNVLTCNIQNQKEFPDKCFVVLRFKAAYLFCSELKIIVYIIGGWSGVIITHISLKKLQSAGYLSPVQVSRLVQPTNTARSTSTHLSSVEQEMVLCLPPLSVSSGAMRPPPPLVSIMRAW
jgi:hypothetical protein